MFGSVSTWEVLLIVLVILVLFGAKKIPEVMRGLGKGLREFRQATREASQELEILTSVDEPAQPTASADTTPQDKPA